MEHHNIDIWPISEDKKPCTINSEKTKQANLLADFKQKICLKSVFVLL